MLGRTVPESSAAPRPSSTVLLVRETPDGAEPLAVLMLERHGGIAFPGAHVFPGGVVEEGDSEFAAARLPANQCWAPAGEGDCPPQALCYWVAAVRELFEETGILLADRNGARPSSAEAAALRVRLAAGEPFGKLLALEGLLPTTDRIFYFARWITPVASPRRWDTRFLVTQAPPDAEAVADGTEAVSAVWLGPRAALAAYEAGRLELAPPTVRTLDDLGRFPSADAVLADAARRVVRAVTPEPALEGDLTTIRYPANRGLPGDPDRRLVLRNGRWRREEA